MAESVCTKAKNCPFPVGNRCNLNAKTAVLVGVSLDIFRNEMYWASVGQRLVRHGVRGSSSP